MGAPRVIVGVTGGIAAYKSCELVRKLKESGLDVVVVPTVSALNFVGEATFAALSGNPVHTDVWADVHKVPHVQLGRTADALVVAPATADFLARAVQGRSDDLLMSTLLTTTAPIVIAPAMHTEMWDNAATQANVATLRERGMIVLDPATGRLTGEDSGKGRMPEPQTIADVVLQALRRHGAPADFAGKQVVVTAGGTREPMDPVRYLGNRSSGLQGYALAGMAAGRGARVTLVSANVSLDTPAGVDVVHVETARQMLDATLDAAKHADVVIMAAAVADYAPRLVIEHKVKKDGSAPSIELTENPDILRALVEARRPGQVIVGFAAETGDAEHTPLEHAEAKLRRKGCDLLVLNDVTGGAAFGSSANTVTILTANGSQQALPTMSKHGVADAVLDAVTTQFSR
jgi:phosphopantothenoylcysteine decarboxylase/phosphopantothenate--cysteine ligase